LYSFDTINSHQIKDLILDHKSIIILLACLQAAVVVGFLLSFLLTAAVILLIVLVPKAMEKPINVLHLLFLYTLIAVPHPFSRYNAVYFIKFGVNFTLIELVFIACVVLIFLHMIIKGEVKFRFYKGRYSGLILFFASTLIWGIFNGIINGASVLQAVFEVRFLLYLPLTYYFTVNLVKSEEDIKDIIKILLIGTTIYSLMGLFYHIPHILRGGDLSQPIDIYHGSLMLAYILLLFFAMFMLNYRHRIPSLFFYLLSFITLYNFLFNFRRAIYLGLVCGLVVILIFFVKRGGETFKRVFILSMVLLLVAAAVGPSFFSVVVSRATSVTEVEYYGQPGSAASNFYRLWEMANFLLNIKLDPFLGIGSGKDWVVFIPFITEPLTTHKFHNTHATLWLKYGLLSLIAFWLLLMKFAFDCFKRSLQERNPFLVATFIAGAGYSICFLVASTFGDYMYYIRPPVWMGLIIGLAAVNLKGNMSADNNSSIIK